MARPSGLQFYNVRLVNQAGLDDDRFSIIKWMVELFKEVQGVWMDRNPDGQFLMIQPTFIPGPLADHEPRCFVLKDKGRSVVRRLTNTPPSSRAGRPASR